MADTIAVLNPMGFAPKGTRRALAPRLPTLEGKTVYLVDFRFDDSISFSADAAWLAEHSPRGHRGGQADLQRVPHDDPPRGGDPDAGPRRHRRGRPLKHLRAGGRRARDDARSDVRRAHRRLHTDKFDRVVRSVATVNGMPGLRQVFVPQPIMGKTGASCARTWMDGIRSRGGR